ncbi:hypothetical protein [Parvularcula maris]|uniref:Uncharacterized protein n=1 Tax=Parvularcula maris TaxID=2965077 RepID=A0A9X2L751_9PROT|nr:hypothetical protein [Parvularcula maris]MCQ8184281.1 hypothetical protein [Parvularcula maris]
MSKLIPLFVQYHRFNASILTTVLVAALFTASCSTTANVESDDPTTTETWIPSLNLQGEWDNSFGGTIKFGSSFLSIPRADIVLEIYKVRDLTAEELQNHRFSRYDDYALDLYFSSHNNRYVLGGGIYFNYSHGSRFNYVDSGAIYRLREPQDVRVPTHAADTPPYINRLSYPVLHDVVIVRKTWNGLPSKANRQGKIREAPEIDAPIERIHVYRCPEPAPKQINFGKVKCGYEAYERFQEGASKPRGWVDPS